MSAAMKARRDAVFLGQTSHDPNGGAFPAPRVLIGAEKTVYQGSRATDVQPACSRTPRIVATGFSANPNGNGIR